MTATIATTEGNNKTTYVFRFNTSNKCICLTQQQLDCIPYLVALVEHKDDFLSIQNENGEYVLNPPIYYNWFMPILHSITSKQPYTLFTKLSEDENILDTFQLFDYLGINSFASPLLKGEDLVLSNSTNEKRRIEYHYANLSETRNTAAEFVIAISKNEYDLYEKNTLKNVFNLMIIIFSNKDVFSSRFRHHTRTIINECCLSFFSAEQLVKLPTIQEIAQTSTINSWIYLSENDQPLPERFHNTFAWKGVYKLTKENDINDDLYPSRRDLMNTLPNSKPRLINFDNFFEYFERVPGNIFIGRVSPSTNNIDQYNHLSDIVDNKSSLRLIEYYYAEEEYISGRKSGRFNTLPKRPNVDKFKRKFGPETQKYR